MTRTSPRNPWSIPVLCFFLACGVNRDQPDGDVYTLVQLVPDARDGTLATASVEVTPAGQTLAWLSDPYTPGASVLEAAATDGINVQPAFVEGAPAAYATTEYWEQWPGAVWANPLYIPITGFDPDTGAIQPLALSVPIFSVDTTSRFYSSYWQIYYLRVPVGTDPTPFVDTRSVLDSGYPLVKGALTFCSIIPDPVPIDGTTTRSVNLAHAENALAVQPLTGTTIQPRKASQGRVDGRSITFLDFGRSRYLEIPNISDPSIVEADVLYQFAVRDPATGARIPLDLPRIGGTGPRGQHRTPVLVQGRPQFGTLWHEWQVLLNPPSGTAVPGVFVPNDHAALRAHLIAEAAGQVQWAPPPDSSLDSILAATAAAYTLRVALNPTACFVQPNPSFPAGPCVWLDSQVSIEANLSQALFTDTQRLSSCPLLVYQNAEVAP